MTGIIHEKGIVIAEDKSVYQLPMRGMDEYLFDAKKVGGRGSFARQKVDKFIGMKVKFEIANETGYNFEII